MRHLADGWNILTLGHLFEIERGGSPRPITDYITDEDDGINWIKIGDTKNKSKYIYSTAEKIKPSGMKKSRFVQEGDFLLSNSMSFGRPYILKTNGCIHDGWLVLRPKNKQVNNDYLYYILGSNYVKRQFEQNASGTTVKNLNIDIVKKTTIPLPPFEQQEKIGKVLDTASALVEKQKALLQKYDLFLKSKFIEMFGDPVKNPMGWNSSKIRSIIQKTTNENPLNFPEKQYLYIDIGSLENKVIKEYNYILGENAPSRARQLTICDDILVSTVRPNLNNVAMVKTDYPNTIASTGFCLLRTEKSKLNSYYLFEVVKHKSFIQSLMNVAKGASYPAVSNNDIFDLQIAVPHISLQNQFAQIVEQVEILKQKEQQKLEKLQTLYDALMKRAFDGEIG